MQVKQHKILIVEDEPGLRFSLQLLLQHEGYSVEVAADGEAGLRAVSLHVPDLIISDVMMPGLDGAQMVRALRANLWGCAVPVIFYTNHPCAKLRTAPDLQPALCLPKDETPLQTLFEAIREKIGRAELPSGSLDPIVAE